MKPLLRRGRLLLLQGVASTLADQLGEAFLEQADSTTAGDALRVRGSLPSLLPIDP